MCDDVHTDFETGKQANSNGISLLHAPKRLPAVMGWTWVALACSIFLDRLGKWLLITAFFCTLFYYFIKFPISNWWPAIFIFYPVAGLIVIYSTIYYSTSQIEEDHSDISAFLSFCRKKFKDLLMLGILQILCISFLTTILGSILNFLFPLLLNFFTWLSSLIYGTESLPTPDQYIDIIILSLIPIVGASLLNGLIFTFIALAVVGFPSPLVIRHPIPPLRAIRMGIHGALSNIRPLLVYLFILFGLDLAIRLLAFLQIDLLPMTAVSIIESLGKNLYLPLLLVFNSLISYVFYLTVWTDAEWEF